MRRKVLLWRDTPTCTAEKAYVEAGSLGALIFALRARLTICASWHVEIKQLYQPVSDAG